MKVWMIPYNLYYLKQWFDHLLSLCQITGFGRRGNKMVQTKIRTVDANSELIDQNTFPENERREIDNLHGKQGDWNITNVRL